jgi:DNA-binding FrmR family transcriptional regulator
LKETPIVKMSLHKFLQLKEALNSIAKILLDGHMKSCVVERIQKGDNEVIDELLTTIQRLMKK